MSTFSSDEERILSQTLDTLTLVSTLELETEATAAHVRRVGARRVGLQFPDGLLSHSGRAVAELHDALGDSPPVDLFVLGDTSFDGFQVDFVTAQHLNADMLVHYGPVDLEAEGPLPVQFVLGRLPIDVPALACACAATFGTRRVLVVPSLPYAHAADALSAALADACPGALVCGVELERAAEGQGQTAGAPSGTADASALTASAHVARGRLLGRTLPAPLDEATLASSDLSLLYIGSEDQTLSNLCMLLNNAAVHICTPPEPCNMSSVGDAAEVDAPGAVEIRQLSLPTAKRLMRRYYLVQKAREAEIVGVLVGTLSASRRQEMLAAIKALIRRAGRKHYVFIMGKLNAAKLANFAEVGVYVLLGSAEHAILDAKDFYRPVVTPYELHLALTSGAEWTGEYILDYGRLLPTLALAGEDDDDADGAQSEDDEPEFSLLTGRLISRRTNRGDDPASSATTMAAASASGGPPAEGGSALVASSGTLAQRGDYAVARTGAEALARRSYQGLDPRLGEHAPARVVEGLSGIASSFAGEGAGRAPPVAALIEMATPPGPAATEEPCTAAPIN